MIQDLIVSLRTFAKQRGYVVSVVLTLALGIGASTMMFSLVDAALLRPLPFHQPDRIVTLTGVFGPQRTPRGASFLEIADWRTMNATLADVSIYDEISLNLRGEAEAVRVDAEVVSPSYFAILGVTPVMGRTFLTEEDAALDQHPVAIVSGRTWQDRRTTPLVAIVNDAAAVRIWGQANAVGRRFRLGGGQGESVEVVGIARTARIRDLTSDLSRAGVEPDVYFPYAQSTDRDIAIAVRRVDSTPMPLAELQQAVRNLDAGLPLFRGRSLEESVRRQTSTARFVASLLTMFSGAALLLAAIGLYGLIAYVVGLSRREIAIRLALGAERSGVAWLIVRNGMILVAVGVAAGAAGAFAAARAIQDQLFQTAGADPAIYLSVAALLVVVALLATLTPTRRALRENPHEALRAE